MLFQLIIVIYLLLIINIHLNRFFWSNIKFGNVLFFQCVGDDEIIKVGDKVIRFKKGDRVISNIDPTHLYGPSRSWSYSLDGPVDGMLTQYKALLYTDLIKIPNHLSYEQTASLLRTGTKTWNALLGNNQLLSGQTVLFQGTGSVSLTGLMLVKAAGCTRIIISDDDEKLKQFKDKYGVDYKINKKKEPN
ncbi:unnamed protein product [Rotaria sp. Silwood2]|nr:unnamed protein product [Rotaria sp. Silwood2]